MDEDVDPEIRDAVAVHIAGCEACRELQRLFVRIDEELGDAPAWMPPKEFVRRVVSQAPIPPPAFRPVAPRSLVPAAVLAALAFAVSFVPGTDIESYAQSVRAFSALWVANAVPVAWISATMALGIAFWFRRTAPS